MPSRSHGPLPSGQNQRKALRSLEGESDLLYGIDLVPTIDVTLGAYRLCFARTGADLEAVRRLRYAVFNVELGEGLNGAHETGLDADAFDRQCQHLMVIHVETGAVIGTYRMQTADSAAQGHGWYTSGEFELDRIPSEMLNRAVELGRACVARPHREKSVLFLLWQGLIAYGQHVGAETFFGCSSLRGTDPLKGIALYAKLIADDKVHPTLYAPPRLALACPLLDWPLREGGREAEEIEIPKLFASYLRNGALILGPPAIDKEFGTIDFLTWVQVKKKHLRRYGQLV